MNFDNEILKALAHLDYAPTMSDLLPSSRFDPYCLHLNLHPSKNARGGSNDVSDEDMASDNGDSDCRSDEDEDDDTSPVYATRSSAHGAKQLTLTGDDDRSNLSHLAAKVDKSKSIASFLREIMLFIGKPKGRSNSDLVNTLSASCEGSSAAISLPCMSSISSVNEFYFDLWMLRCKRRCSHAYSGACLRPLLQRCCLPPIRWIQICRRLS